MPGAPFAALGRSGGPPGVGGNGFGLVGGAPIASSSLLAVSRGSALKTMPGRGCAISGACPGMGEPLFAIGVCWAFSSLSWSPEGCAGDLGSRRSNGRARRLGSARSRKCATAGAGEDRAGSPAA